MIHYKEITRHFYVLVDDELAIEYSDDYKSLLNRTSNIKKGTECCHIDIMFDRVTFVYPASKFNSIPIFDVVSMDGERHAKSYIFFSQNSYVDSVAKMLKTIGFKPFTKRGHDSIEINESSIIVPILRISSSASLYVSIDKTERNLIECTKFALFENDIPVIDCSFQYESGRVVKAIKSNDSLLFQVSSNETECIALVDFENALRLHTMCYRPKGFRWCKSSLYIRMMCYSLIDLLLLDKTRGTKSKLQNLRRELNKNKYSEEYCTAILIDLINIIIYKKI